MTVRLPVLFCLLFLISGIRGEDFSLSDALGDATTKPTTAKKLPTTAKPADDKDDTGFKLEDVLGGDEALPTKKPQPGQGGGDADDTGFKLDDAIGGDAVPTKKPQPGQGGGGSHDGGFSLDDAIGGDEALPTEKPQPGQGGGGGGGSFSNDDLSDAIGGVSPDDPNDADGHQKGRAMHPSSGGEGEGQEKQSVIAGVLSALGVAAVGAVSSFIAYQKKKLCFKGQADDPENVDMNNQKGDQNDPQAQTNLLAK